MVRFTTNKWDHGMDESVTVAIPAVFGGELDALIQKVHRKHNGYMTVSFDIPHKPRTVGKFSQNNHAWGHARQIGGYTGEDVEVVIFQECLRAEKRGYPCETNKFGDRVPKPFKEASTQEAYYVIEQMHEDAAFLGLTLEEV
jgi:hypothetical protein